jgi:hypothetical protein
MHREFAEKSTDCRGCGLQTWPGTLNRPRNPLLIACTTGKLSGDGFARDCLRHHLVCLLRASILSSRKEPGFPGIFAYSSDPAATESSVEPEMSRELADRAIISRHAGRIRPRLQEDTNPSRAKEGGAIWQVRGVAWSGHCRACAWRPSSSPRPIRVFWYADRESVA